MLFGSHSGERASENARDESNRERGLAAAAPECGESGGVGDRGVGFVAMDVGNFA